MVYYRKIKMYTVEDYENVKDPSLSSLRSRTTFYRLDDFQSYVARFIFPASNHVFGIEIRCKES